ncbi:dipeptidase 3 [Immersiella caudata]|uniref:Dipeptidase n=1 Tax=Immersiella caudata TaxID=314043 RepID=A0AA39WL87_9PEZI|nr:dipeptidase 3 [Immersiella caudata]
MNVASAASVPVPVPVSGNGVVDVDQLLRKFPLVDGHNDFAWMVRGWLQNQLDDSGLRELQDMPIGQTDLGRFKKSRVGCQFWSAFVPCPSKDDDFSTTPLLDTLRTTLQQIDLLHTIFALHSETFEFVDNSSGILSTFKNGRIASLIGVEGLHQIANSASVLRMLYRLGVRYVTLCHDANNRYVDSATSKAPVFHGLSAAGCEVINEMNRIGMMIDLSHTSHDAQGHVLSISTAPVIFSHSSCYALCPHPRNVTDQILDELKQNGGIIMICFLPSLVEPGRGKKATLQDVVEHILYAGNRIGYAHVGIGSDFDGMLNGPEGLEDVTRYPQLVAELASRGLSEKDLAQVLGLNLIRVMREVEEAAMKLQERKAVPLFDQIPHVWTQEQRSLLAEAGSMRNVN